MVARIVVAWDNAVSNKAVYLILAVSLLLNMWGITYGLPDIYFSDEFRVVWRAFHLNDDEVSLFKYPHLFMHLLVFIYKSYLVIAQIINFTSTSDIYISFSHNPTPYYLIARIIVAIMGTATVFMTYLVGKIMFHKGVAAASAAFLAGSPLFVLLSHEAKVEIPMALFIMIAFYYSILLMKTGQFKYYILAGVFSGFAMSTKYPGAISVVALMAAHFMSSSEGKNKRTVSPMGVKITFFALLVFGILIVMAGFYVQPMHIISFTERHIASDGEISKAGIFALEAIRKASICFGMGIFFLGLSAIGIFYSKSNCIVVGFLSKAKDKKLYVSILLFILAFSIGTPEFSPHIYQSLRSIADEAYRQHSVYFGQEQSSVGWIWYLPILSEGFGFLKLLVAAIGIVFCLTKRNKLSILLICLPIPYYFLMGSCENKQSWFMVPMLPFLAILCAYSLITLLNILKFFSNKKPVLIFWIMAAFLVTVPVCKCVKSDYQLTLVDSRTLGKEWIKNNIPPGTNIAVEGHSPPISAERYNLFSSSNFRLGDLHSLDPIYENQIDYVVITSLVYEKFCNVPEIYTKEILFYDLLDAKFELLTVIKPVNGGLGPIIKIYKTIPCFSVCENDWGKSVISKIEQVYNPYFKGEIKIMHTEKNK